MVARGGCEDKRVGPGTCATSFPRGADRGCVQHDLSVTQGAVQLTLTATAIGMGVGQLLVGPMSDAFGRRRPLLIATALHVLSSIAVAAAPTVAVVTLARFGQGLGAAASAVVAVAMVRDLFGGYRLVRMLARIGLISGLAPIIAPVIGSQLLLVVSWRGVFAALAAYGLVILVVCVLAVPETLAARNERAPENATSLSRLRAVLRDRVFVGAAITGSMIFATVVTYLSTSPFVFQSDLGLTPQEFGALFAVNAVGLLFAAQLSARLMRFLEPAWMLGAALAVLLVSGSALVILGVSHAGFPGIAAASFVFVSTTGFANPCVGVLTLKDHHGRAGTAAAITGFANSVIGGLISPLPGVLGGATALSLGVVVCAGAVVALLALFLVLHPRRVPKLDRT
ncbi:Bcr/CflA family efflux MFS transporter [Leifsonia sp. Leaf336]|uniref:Bcr/CflA family efflux MFS transporter n=1 Tax=Leifsonia sp. Leaf336 TaxID=1736341 RepID=UPI0009E767FF|nr:Bcr/CflA family efflux MFS transporter [Leifsonia sp. Leaf336]